MPMRALCWMKTPSDKARCIIQSKTESVFGIEDNHNPHCIRHGARRICRVRLPSRIHRRFGVIFWQPDSYTRDIDAGPRRRAVDSALFRKKREPEKYLPEQASRQGNCCASHKPCGVRSRAPPTEPAEPLGFTVGRRAQPPRDLTSSCPGNSGRLLRVPAFERQTLA
jgi:hypothetical protein